MISSGEPPLRVYDTSGPYTDPKAAIDISSGLPQLRRDWIMGRGEPSAEQRSEVLDLLLSFRYAAPR